MNMTENTSRKTISQPKAFDYFLILLVAFIWSSAFIAIKYIIDDFEPLFVSTSRVVIGFGFLLSYLLVSLVFFDKKKATNQWPTGKSNWIKLLIIAAFYTSIPFTLISWGQQYISATLTSIVMGASPLIGYINAHFTTSDEKLNPLKIIAVLLGTLGIYLATDLSQSLDISASIWGMAAMFAALTCYSAAGTLTRRVSNGSATHISTIILGIGSCYLLPVLFISGQYEVDFSALKTETILALIYIGVFPTGLAYLIRFHLILKIGFTGFLTSVFFIPIFGVFLAALLLGEPLTANIFFALIILIASLLISRKAGQKS